MTYTVDDENYLNFNKKRIVFPNTDIALQQLSENKLNKNKDVIHLYIENEDKEVLSIYNYNGEDRSLTIAISPISTIPKTQIEKKISYHKSINDYFGGVSVSEPTKLYLIKSIKKYITKNPEIINKIIPSKELVNIINEYDSNKNVENVAKYIAKYILNIESIFEYIHQIKNGTKIPLKNIIFILFLVINNTKRNRNDIDYNFINKFLNLIFPMLEKDIQEKNN